MYAAYYDFVGFCGARGKWRCSEGFYPFGKRRFAIGRKNYRQLFYPADSYFHRVDSDYAAWREDISACIRSQRKYN